jgi:hypothetical protein
MIIADIAPDVGRGQVLAIFEVDLVKVPVVPGHASLAVGLTAARRCRRS